jgi:hypothetical protein
MKPSHAPEAHIAGEVAASGGRPAAKVARRIILRLAADGHAIVPSDREISAWQTLVALDEVLSFPAHDEPDALAGFAKQVEISDPASVLALAEACGRARALLDCEGVQS